MLLAQCAMRVTTADPGRDGTALFYNWAYSACGYSCAFIGGKQPTTTYYWLSYLPSGIVKINFLCSYQVAFKERLFLGANAALRGGNRVSVESTDSPQVAVWRSLGQNE